MPARAVLRRTALTSLSLLASLAPIAYAPDAAALPISPDKTYKKPPPSQPYKPPPPSFPPPPADGFYWSAEPRAHKGASAWRPITWPESDKVVCDKSGRCRKAEHPRCGLLFIHLEWIFPLVDPRPPP